MNLQQRIEQSIFQISGSKPEQITYTHATGGCINQSQILSLHGGSRFFLKTHDNASACPGMYAAEFKALMLIKQTGSIRVPTPLAFDNDFLLLEYFTESSKGKNWYKNIGEQLAHLHLAAQSDSFGFDENNYIGTSQQINSKNKNWSSFWSEHRLGYQLQLFSDKTSKDDPLIVNGYRLRDQLDLILSVVDEPAVLLHGDLWSGNAAADEHGAPIIFDPASYYGHREVEFGMMRMFGGFGVEVEAAYQEIYPFKPDYDRRINLYRLYHELNHLNLFGRSYYDSCLTSIKSLL